MIGRIAVASISVIAFSAAANAADMYVPAPVGFVGYKDAPYVSDWAGFYIGIHGGGGWAKTDFPSAYSAPALEAFIGVPNPPGVPSQNPSGGLVGGHAGYNWQYGRFVGGLEVDFDAADIKSSANLPFVLPPAAPNQRVKIDELASVRGRLGWEVRPNLLAYGTGGLAMGHFQSAITETAPGFYLNGDASSTAFGWVAGAGLEYKILDHWLLRAEYLHYDFGTVTDLHQTSLFQIDGVNARTAIDSVRGGVSYKFGPEGAAEAGLKDITAYRSSDWAGFYIGVNGGGGWAHTDFPRGISGPLLPFPAQSGSGGVAGGHAGYNWQYGRIVTGLEADFDAADIKGTVNLPVAPSTFSQTLKIDELASVRARLGWEVTPDLLAYGTAGLGLGHTQSSFQASFAQPVAPGVTVPRNITQATGAAEFGWAAGAGLEYKLLDRWLLRAEYLHYDFGTVNNLFNAAVVNMPPIDSTSSRTAVDVVRGGVSYKFGPAGAAEAGLKDTASVSDWSGLYVGIDGGGGWARTDFPRGYKDSLFDPVLGTFSDPSQSSSGGLVGGHIGYNWQYERLVGGLEADFDAAGIHSTANLAFAAPSIIHQEVKTDELASVRARLGWTVRPDLLAYATGGLALGHFQSTFTNHGVNDPFAPGLAAYDLRTSAGAAEFGWVAGAGFEYKLLDHLLLRTEYLHYDFGRVSNSFYTEGATPAVESSNARSTVDVVRGGVSYKF
jgi:outer membrane immunogenic protein